MSESRVHIDGRHVDVALQKSVADLAAEQAVKKTFIAMGLDPEKPFEAQQDMVWLRSTRQRCEGAGVKALLTLTGLVIVGMASAFWVGFKSLLLSGPRP